MKEQIIKSAGKIWKHLATKGEVAITQIAKNINEKPEVLYQALGWLAREDKVQYRKEKRSTYVSLVDAEQEIYNSLVKDKKKKTAKV